MMWYRRRSAKSVAWRRLNVIGVSDFFFLPILVAAFTSAEEFHSVWKTGSPPDLSHFARRASCVVLPDPSMPSTTNSFPGYSCGVVRLFSMSNAPLAGAASFAPGYVESKRPFEHLLERRR